MYSVHLYRVYFEVDQVTVCSFVKWNFFEAAMAVSKVS